MWWYKSYELPSHIAIIRPEHLSRQITELLRVAFWRLYLYALQHSEQHFSLGISIISPFSSWFSARSPLRTTPNTKNEKPIETGKRNSALRLKLNVVLCSRASIYPTKFTEHGGKTVIIFDPEAFAIDHWGLQICSRAHWEAVGSCSGLEACSLLDVTALGMHSRDESGHDLIHSSTDTFVPHVF